MKRRLFLSLFILVFSLPLAGCADVGDLNLTQSEEEQVVGYCADLLLKYDKNHSSNVVDTSLARELQARVEAIKEMNRNSATEETVSDNKGKKGKKDSGESAGPRFAPVGEQDIAAALGQQQGLSVNYKGMEVVSSYSGDDGGFFTLDAAPGKQLIVLEFDVVNDSGSDAECDMLSSGAQFKVVVNESESYNVLTTLLSDDLSTMAESIPSGDKRRGVLVMETDPGFEEGISSLSLQIKGGGSESIIPLK